MGKNLLIISASPRKGGNSDTLCDEFLKGAVESGNHGEKIFLRNKKIGYCTGCGFCADHHKCSQNDDMAEILDKMVNADVIVMATPVYFYTMNAQMKTFIDRTDPRYREISNKDFYFIVTATNADKQAMQRTIEGFRGFTDDCLEGTKEKDIIYGLGAKRIGDIHNNPAMKQAYEMGKNI